jgi:hypothetical protein
MKSAIVEISLELLGNCLQLPKDVEVVRVVHELDHDRSVSMLLVGDGLPDSFTVHVGGLVKKANPMLHRETNDDSVTWEWEPKT